MNYCKICDCTGYNSNCSCLCHEHERVSKGEKMDIEKIGEHEYYDIWKKSTYTEVESDDNPNQYYAKKTDETLIVIPATEEEQNKFEEFKADDYGNQDYNYQVKYKKVATLSVYEIHEILTLIDKYHIGGN